MEDIENKRLTKQEAIRAFCLECAGDSWRDVRDCTAKNCPLYRYRLGHEDLSLGNIPKRYAKGKT